MKYSLLTAVIGLFYIDAIIAQTTNKLPDPVDNTIHAANYRPSETNAVPAYTKYGRGKKSLVLIPGLGFDASVFSDFIDATKKDFTIYALTLPGFGNTQAPMMPASKTSYGENSWNRSAEEGIVKLIEIEKIVRPILVGHFVSGTQVATTLAARYPERIGGLILIGGPVKFISVESGQVKDYDVTDLIRFTDSYTAPVMFKKMPREAWDAGNYLPEVYALDSAAGNRLWAMSASVPMPVMVRYLCEYIASDISTLFARIECPILILRPQFTLRVLTSPPNNYLRSQFIDKWSEVMLKGNKLMKIVDIQNAGVFAWKDSPDKVYLEIKRFSKSIKKATR